jgi:hypothetical protein
MMIDNNATVVADNGQQVFLACDINRILSDVYDKEVVTSEGIKITQSRYTDVEICENYEISKTELNRMKHLLSYEYNNK